MEQQRQHTEAEIRLIKNNKRNNKETGLVVLWIKLHQVKTIQTDNGFEFTNRLSWQAFMKNKKTMFEKTIEELGIEYKVIRPHTPKQNGRVERSHRKDQERFYYKKVKKNRYLQYRCSKYLF